MLFVVGGCLLRVVCFFLCGVFVCVVCCLLFVIVCWLLVDGFCSLSAVCCAMCVVCCVLFAVCCAVVVERCVMFAVRCGGCVVVVWCWVCCLVYNVYGLSCVD